MRFHKTARSRRWGPVQASYEVLQDGQHLGFVTREKAPWKRCAWYWNRLGRRSRPYPTRQQAAEALAMKEPKSFYELWETLCGDKWVILCTPEGIQYPKGVEVEAWLQWKEDVRAAIAARTVLPPPPPHS